MRWMLIGVFMLFHICVTSGQQRLHVTEISAHLYVFATSTGNVIASVGPDGALLVGTPSVDSTPGISAFLAGRTRSPIRYVVISPESPSDSEGDAGWGRRGAFVAMQENALGRLGGHVMGPPRPLPPRLRRLRVERPRVSFSDVLCFDLNGEAIHVVRQSPGYSDADAIVHYHVANVVYMGEAFPGDGYPIIDDEQDGSLDGLVKTLSAWTDSRFRVVPARGAITNGNTLKLYVDMITTVEGRVRKLYSAGRTKEQIIRSHPTAGFDAQWGHGRESADGFVQELYKAVANGTGSH